MSQAALRWSTVLKITLLCTLMGLPQAHAQDAAQTLKARYGALEQKLTHNPFNRPLVLLSSEYPNGLKGEVYAVVEYPFDVVNSQLGEIKHWCDILILHQNVKRCINANTSAGQTLQLSIGQKSNSSLADAYPFTFLYTAAASNADYLNILLKAAEGPLDTRLFRIELEAVPLDAQRSFLHLSYSYTYGLSARLAMVGYLATTGHNKVGFSIVGQNTSGESVYVGNTLGVIERNTMRYYLAIDAYLATLLVPPPAQQEQRLRAWHAAVERYPQQLHELELGPYLKMKREEIQRQQIILLK